jgi:uncharacterized protein GlcG (DUF336 family)
MSRAVLFVLPLALALACTGCEKKADSTGIATNTAGEMKQMPGDGSHHECAGLPNARQVRQWLNTVPAEGQVGGLGGGLHEWAAIVDRQGRLCVIVTSDQDPSMTWPGSQGIAKAKAFTANGFSSDKTPMSTARLYTMGQPGRSLYGAGAGDPFNPKCLNAPDSAGGIGEVCGGLITFGGGVPLYRDKVKVGAIGLSGDTPCADHEVAKRVRTAARLDPPGGAGADDILYSSTDGASIYTHPLCPNTWRNGRKIGDAPPSQGY